MIRLMHETIRSASGQMVKFIPVLARDYDTKIATASYSGMPSLPKSLRGFLPLPASIMPLLDVCSGKVHPSYWRYENGFP